LIKRETVLGLLLKELQYISVDMYGKLAYAFYQYS